jgi:hypothetical protein
MSNCLFVSNDNANTNDPRRLLYKNSMTVSQYVSRSKSKNDPNLLNTNLAEDKETGETNYLVKEELNFYEENINDDDDQTQLEEEDDYGFNDEDSVERNLRGSAKLLSNLNLNSVNPKRKTYKQLEPEVLIGNSEEIFQAIKNDVGDMIPREYVVIEDENACEIDYEEDPDLYKSRFLFDSILKSLVFKYLRRAYYFAKAKYSNVITEDSMKLALFNNYLGIKSSLEEYELARSLGTSALTSNSSHFREIDNTISLFNKTSLNVNGKGELNNLDSDPNNDYLRSRSNESAVLQQNDDFNQDLCFLCRDDKTDLQIISSEYTNQRISSLRDLIINTIVIQGYEISKLYIKENSPEFIILVDYLTYASIFLYTLSENEVTGNVMKGVTFSEYNIKLQYLYINSIKHIIKRYSKQPQPSEIYNILSKLTMFNKNIKQTTSIVNNQIISGVNNSLIEERKEGTIVEGSKKYPYEEDFDMNKIFIARYMTDRLYNILVALTLEYEQSNNQETTPNSNQNKEKEPFDIFYVLSIEYGDYAKKLYETLKTTICDDSYLQLRAYDQMTLPNNINKSYLNLINRITSCIFNMFLIELNGINIYSMYENKLLIPKEKYINDDVKSDYFITGNKSTDTKPIFKYNSENKLNAFSDIITSTIPVYSFL